MVSWTAENDRKILLSVLDKVPKVDYKQIALDVGDGCTERAVQERIKTLKKLKNSSTSESSHTPKSSPKKRKVECDDPSTP